MIIDLILDRKHGFPYNAKEFYKNVMLYEEGTDFEISRALDGGTEKDVKKALCDYVIENGYNPSICNYINKTTWLKNDRLTYKQLAKRYFELMDYIEDFIIADDTEDLVISSDPSRKESIDAMEQIIDSAQFYLQHLKDLEDELLL